MNSGAKDLGPRSRLGWVKSFVLIPIAWFMTIGAPAFYFVGVEERHPNGWLNGVGTFYSVIAMAAAIYACYLFTQRRQNPRRTGHILAALQLVLPVGPVLAIVLPRYIRTQPAKDGIYMSGFYGVSLIVTMARDLLGQSADTSILRSLMNVDDTDGGGPISITSLISIFLITFLLPIGLGYWEASRDALEETEGRLFEQVGQLKQRDVQLEEKEHQLGQTSERLEATSVRLEQTSEELEERSRASEEMEYELSRKEEREIMARDIHDTVGHRLSLVSLHAGVLEMLAQDDELKDKAVQVRQEAQQAVDELRGLVHIMRNPAKRTDTFDYDNYEMTDLADVIEHVLGAGHPVSSSVFVTDPEKALGLLTKSTYRIVQELLTNAIKHAPGEIVRVKVKGGPGQGLNISVANPVTGGVKGAGLNSGPAVGFALTPHDPQDSASSTSVPQSGESALTTREGGARVGGLTGIRERALAMGGWVLVTEEDGEFRVDAWLPWEKGSAAE